MRALIEQLAAPNPLFGRSPISIAFRLVKLGHFADIREASKVVHRVLNKVPFRKN